MGWSIAILAFALEDADHVLSEMQWTETRHEVGVPVDMSSMSIDEILDPTRQAENDPHFSSARGAEHFFVYASLKELGPFVYPDVATLSDIAPLIAYIVVETSDAASVERWHAGQRVWSVGGASNQDYEITGDAPVDLKALAREYRSWWTSLPHGDPADYEPGELDLPKRDEDLIVHAFSSLVGNYFANLTGFRYSGDHPPLYRLEGELATVDTRRNAGE